MITPFVPTQEKLIDLARRLKDTRLYLSDEDRNDDTITLLLCAHLGGITPNVFFELGDWGGLLGFANVVPGWKADMFFKLWDKAIWGPTLCREMDVVIKKTFNELGLKRLSLCTPDGHMTRLARWHGFEYEGLLLNGFRWDGDYFDITLMAKY